MGRMHDQAGPERIFGIETEFGCLVDDDSTRPESIVEAVKNHVFYDLRIGSIDAYARDEMFEPAFSGGFLLNGGRLYIDVVGSHLEYATAECRTLRDLIANDRAGQAICVKALETLGLSDTVSLYNNSIDHFGGHTFGCHENYMVLAFEEFFTEQVPKILPFFVTRQIFAGVGRVGGHRLVTGMQSLAKMDPVDYVWVSNFYDVAPDDSVQFQLSQRADHIIRTVASRVRFNRAIINPKWDQYMWSGGMNRLHVLFGEANQNQFAYALKVGTTALVLELTREDLIPDDLLLANPLLSLREVSRDPEYRWECEMQDGSRSNALELQNRYLELCQKVGASDEDSEWVLQEWERILNDLANDPLSTGDRVDWVAKKKLIEHYIENSESDWGDDVLHSLDLEYHNIDPSKSLYSAFADSNSVVDIVGLPDIVVAGTDPPSNTRASARANWVEHVVENRKEREYLIDWSGVARTDGGFVEFPDPLKTYEGSRPQSAGMESLSEG